MGTDRDEATLCRECEALVRHLEVALLVCEPVDGELVVRGANPCAERLLGGALVSGVRLREVVPVELADHIARLPHRRDAGDERAFALRDRRVSVQAFGVHDGRVGVAMEDITEAHRAREALARSEAQLAEAQAITHLGSWIWEIGTDHVEWSAELFRIFGHAPHSLDLDYDAYLTRVHPEDRERVARDIERAATGDRAFDHLQRIIRPDGEIRFLHSRGRVLAQADRSVMVGTCLDVTEMHLRESELRRSEQRYRRSFEYDVSGDFMASREGKLLAVNETLARILGCASTHELIDARLVELFPSTEAYDRFFERLVQTRRLDNFELELRRRDGEAAHVVGNFIADLDAAGDLEQLIGYVIDVSARKRLEEQLRQMQKLDAIGRLAGGMAHDFNNLLTIILNYAALLRRRIPDGSDDRGSVEAIEEAAQAAGSLTRQLLTFARGQLAAARVMDVNAALRDMERMTRRLLGDDVAFQLELDDAPLYVWADPGQLEQIVLNLAANARDAMPHGGVFRVATAHATVTAADSAYPGVPGGEYAMIRVSDTGPGIQPEVREQMFEPFYSTKAPGEGTGLGLSTVYGIVMQAEGRILVDSAPGAGAGFTIFWPIRAEAEASEARVPDVEPPARGTETVLVVEDAERLRGLISEVLEEQGYRVLAAANAKAALELAGSDRIDVLLSDVVMPGMSGIELSALVRDVHPGVHVIYMSGYSTHRAVQIGSVQPDASFLPKPFSPERLLEKVRAAIDAR